MVVDGGGVFSYHAGVSLRRRCYGIIPVRRHDAGYQCGAASIIVIEMSLIVGSDSFSLSHFPEPTPHPPDYSNTKELGRVLYTLYVYPFEIAAVILLVAIVAAIALTMRRRSETKYQNPARQVSISARERVRLVKMAAEKKR